MFKNTKDNLKIKIAKFSYNLGWLILKPIIFLIFKPKFYNIENINNLDPPLIFSSNHKSFLDSFIIGLGFPFRSKIFPIFWIAAEKYVKMPIIGFIVRLFGSISVKKGLGAENSLKEALYYLKEKKINIGIFPEGKVVFDKDKIEVFKKGIGYLFYQTKAPIIPVAIRLDKKFEFSDLIKMKNKALIFLGRPIYEINANNYEEIANYLQKLTIDLFKIKDYYIEAGNLKIKLEKISLLNKIIHSIFLPFLNSKFFIFLIRKLSNDDKKLFKNHILDILIEAVDNLPKKNFFSFKLFGQFLSFIFEKLLFQTKALVNRSRIVKFLIKENLISFNNQNEIKILSLKEGFLRLIISAISEINDQNFIKKIKLYYIDNNEKYNYLSNQVKKEFNLDNLKIETINIDVWLFLDNPKNYIAYTGFDIIGLIGVLDRLPEKEVINRLNGCYDLLKNSGCLIASNIAPNNEMKFLENISLSKLYYRNIVDWVYILKNTKFNKATKIIEEPLKFHNIIFIYKQT